MEPYQLSFNSRELKNFFFFDDFYLHLIYPNLLENLIRTPGCILWISYLLLKFPESLVHIRVNVP